MRICAGIMFACVVAGASLVSGCAGLASAPVVPPTGLVFTRATVPLDANFNKT